MQHQRSIALVLFLGLALSITARIHAEDLIGSGLVTANAGRGVAPQTVFIGDQTGYAFYVNASGNACFSKTGNAGGIWGAGVPVDTHAGIIRVAIWYDRWTPGCTSNLIHVWSMTATSVYYQTVNTASSDALATDPNPTNTTTLINSGITNTFAIGNSAFSACRSTNDILYVAVEDSGGGGTTWIRKCTVGSSTWTAAGTSPLNANQSDKVILMPLAGNNILAIEFVAASNLIRSWKYTASSGLWAATVDNVDAAASGNATYFGTMSATVDPADNSIYVAYCADINTLGGAGPTLDDVRVKKFDGTNWAALSSGHPVVDSAKGITDCAIALDRTNSTLYVAYCGQTTVNNNATTNVYWKSVTLSGPTWSAESSAINTPSGAGNIEGVFLNTMSYQRIYAAWWVSGGTFRGNMIVDLKPVVSISATDTQAGYTFGTGTYRITRADDTFDALTVNYTVSGSAASGTDFTALSGSVSIPSNSLFADITLTAVDTDTTAENDETVILTLTADTNYTISGGAATVTIIDDDTPDVSLTLTDSTATEGGADTATFTVTRVGNTVAALNVLYSVGGSATSGTDFAALSGTCTIAAGSSSATIVVDCSGIADTTAENDETVSITLTTNAAYNIVAGGPLTATIIDNDTPSVTLTVSDSSATEGSGADTATFTITRVGNTLAALSVLYSVGGSATSGTDFAALSGTCTIAIGSSSNTVVVDCSGIADTTPENDETVSLTITADAAYSIAAGGPLSVTLIDNDTPSVTLTATDNSAAEGGADTATFTVTRVGNTVGALNVLYSIGGTATSGTDFAALSGTCTIAAGSASGTIVVDCSGIADTTAENDETVTITLTADAAYSIAAGGPLTATIIDNDTPSITLTLTDSSATEGSGADTAVFTVTRVGNTIGSLNVLYSVGGTAASGTDFAALSGTCTIAAASSSNTIVIDCSGIADTTAENDETVSITLTADVAYSIASGGPLSATIVDNDTPSVTLTVSDSSATEGSGADTATFTITRVGNTLAALSVLYSVGGSATSGTDFAALSGTCTIAIGSSSNTVVVDCSGSADTAAENDETVSLTVSADAAYTIAAGGPLSVTLFDNDTPDVTLTLTDNSATEGGADTATFTVTRVGNTVGALNVLYSVGGSASSGTDFAALSGTCTIAAGSASGTIVVDCSGIADTTAENDETVTITLTANAAYAIAAGGPFTATIIDNDTPDVTLTVTDNSATEGGADTATFTVTRVGNTLAPLNVLYSVGGTATSGADFAALSGTCTIGAGNPSATIVVDSSAIADTTAEDDETVSITLTANAAYSIAAGGPLTATIVDDDTPSVTLTVTDASALEGTADTATFTVTRVGNTLAPLNVLYTVGGTAASGTDFAALSGTCTIGAGSSANTIVVDCSAIADTAIELDETVTVTLTADAAYSIGGGGPLAVTLVDDDQPRLTLSVTDATATEGGADTAIFTITRVSNDNSADLDVFYTVGGSASSGADFAALSGTCTIPGGSTTATIVIDCSAIADTVAENDETVSITLTANVNYGITVGGPLSITIVDDDLPSVTLALSDATATEGGADTATFTVTRVGNTSLPVDVLYSVGGTASSGADYAALSGTCTIAAGNSSATIVVNCAGAADTTAENDETVIITLTADAAYTLAAAGPFTATLIDDDTPDVSIAVTDAAAIEPGVDTGAYTIARVGNTLAALTVNFTVGGTANSGVDYTALGASVSIPIGQNSATLTVTALDDATVENDETVTVTLDVGAYNITTPLPQTIAVVDNELPEVTIVATDATANESGDPAIFTVTRLGNTLLPLTVNYTVTGGATSGSDYIALTETVVIPATQQTATITLTPVDNATAENDESVILTLSPDAAYTLGAPTVATATIIDDDPPEISIIATDSTATENGDTGSFTITRVGSTAAALTINFTVGGTAVIGTDYSDLGTSVLLPIGVSSTVLTVTTQNDAVAEYDDTVIVTLAAGAGYAIGPTGAATVTILDDEPPLLTIVATDAIAAEPGVDTGSFTITRLGRTTDPLTVFFVKSGTASSSDYHAIGTSVLLPAGSTSVSITLIAADDSLVEPDETVILTLLADPAYDIGAPDNATVTIQDDESVVSIAATTSSALETGGIATFTVSRTGNITGARTINYTVGGTAAGGQDYIELTRSLLMPAGAATAEINVEALDDQESELDETVIVTLQPGLSYVVDVPNTATVTLVDDEPAEVSLAATDAVAGETGGNTATFTVTRLGNCIDPLTVFYTVGGTATAGVDYSALSGSVVIPAGQATAPITVTALDDLLTDNGETVIVTLSVDPAYRIGGENNASVIILDDEAVEVSVVASIPNAAEPAVPGAFTVSRDPAAPTVTALTVSIKMSGTATNSKDYKVLGTTVTIPAGQSSVDVAVIPVDDKLAEPDETVIMTVQNTAMVRAHAVNGAATVTITDDENVVSIVATSNAAEPATNGTFTVSRTGSTSAPITVNFLVSGTATQDVDYAHIGTTVALGSGVASVPITIAPVDEALIEADETVTVILAAGTGYVTAVGSASATLTLTDDEPRVSIGVTTAKAAEPFGTGVLTVTRTGPTFAPLTVNYTIAGSATPDVDYTALTGTVTFGIGSDSEPIDVFVLDDLIAENDETVIVTLGAGAGYSLGTATATVTVVCNEIPEVKIQVADAKAVEPGTDTGSFLVTRTGNTLSALQVFYTVAGVATPGIDYVPLSGWVTIPAGQSTAPIVVAALDDSLAENDESVELTLSANSAYTVDAGFATAVVNVVDNEPAVVTISAVLDATEGGAPGAITVHRRGNTLTALKVPYTLGAGSTASSGIDYAELPLLATIPIGAESVDIAITPLNESLVEADESVTVILTPPAKGYVLGTPATGTAMIIDDELRLTIVATTPTVPETGPGNAQFTVSRNITTDPMIVAYTVSGTASSGVDYTALSGTVSLGVGVASATIDVTPLDDADIEQDETVIVTLTADPSFSFGSDNATVKILDDEPRVSIAISDASAAEPANNGAFTVSRTGPTGASLTVNYSVSGSALAGTDYAALSGSVTLGVGVSSAPVSVNVLDDGSAENDETVTVTIDPDVTYSLDDDTKSATIVIVDDELPVISIAATDSVASEPGTDTGEFTVTRTGNTLAALTVNYTVSGTATSAIDFAALPVSVTIPAGQASATITVTALNNTVAENDETVILTIGANAAYTVGAGSSATVTLIDDDKPLISVAAIDNMAAENAGAEPANPAKFRITRFGNTVGLLKVTYKLSGKAVIDVDYAAPATPLTVDIQPGDAFADVDIIPIDDNLVEATEDVILTVVKTASYALNTVYSATATILDNEPRVSIVASDATGNENGDTARFTVSRTGTTVGDVTVNFKVMGTAKSGIDYTSIGISVVIPDGQVAVDITVTPLDDSATPVAEIDETVIVTLLTGTGYAPVAPLAATVTIQDDEPKLSIVASLASIPESGGTSTLTISRTGDTTAALAGIKYTVGGTAKKVDDYLALPATATILAGQASVDIVLTAVDNAVSEPDETVIVTLVAAPAYSLAAPASATVTIIDDENRVSIVATTPASEAGPTNGEFTVSRTTSTGDLTVKYAISGTATAGDYLAFGTQVVILDGNFDATITVTPVDDTLLEPTETVILTLLPSATYSLGTSTATVGIADSSGGVTINATDPDALEGSLDTGKFTVSRPAGDTVNPLKVNLTIGGTATAKLDYTLVAPTVTIPAGAASVEITVNALADLVIEGDETVIVTVASGVNYSVGAASSATVTIHDNDNLISIAATDPIAGEPKDTGTWTVSRTGSTKLAMTVNYTISGTATNGKDYKLGTSVKFKPGAATATILLKPAKDYLIEPLETVTLTLAPSAQYNVDPTPATITIQDLPVVSLAALDPTALEVPNPLDAGAFLLTRTGSLAQALPVKFKLAGTAKAKIDYVALPKALIIPAGSASLLLPVTAINNAVVNQNRSVILSIVKNSTYNNGAQSSATISIVDGAIGGN